MVWRNAEKINIKLFLQTWKRLVPETSDTIKFIKQYPGSHKIKSLNILKEKEKIEFLIANINRHSYGK